MACGVSFVTHFSYLPVRTGQTGYKRFIPGPRGRRPVPMVFEDCGAKQVKPVQEVEHDTSYPYWREDAHMLLNHP